MRDEDIYVGDVLRVRNWDDVINEFSVSPGGNMIIFKNGKQMLIGSAWKYMFGEKFTVKNAVKSHWGIVYKSWEGIENRWGITLSVICEMLEPFIDEDIEVATDDEISVLLGKAG